VYFLWYHQTPEHAIQEKYCLLLGTCSVTFTGTINRVAHHLEPQQEEQAAKPVTEDDRKNLKAISDTVSTAEN